MKIRMLYADIPMPKRSTEGAGGYDIYMPSDGSCMPDNSQTACSLGFKAEVPQGFVALILPRSGVGMNYQLELNNTCGVIDSDYRGEWMAKLRTKDGSSFSWEKRERLFQFILVPVAYPNLVLVDSLDDTERGENGFGSTGK